jgi:uncharacterized protein YkwD
MNKRKLFLYGSSLLFLGSLTYVILSATHTYPVNAQNTAVLPTAPSIIELWTLTNEERAKAGVPALVLDPVLNASASAKCQANVTQNSFEHDLPDGTTWTSFITEKYMIAGENLAYDPQERFTAQDTVANWMNSEHHRYNILKPEFTNVGFAVCSATDFVTWGNGSLIEQQFTDLQP